MQTQIKMLIFYVNPEQYRSVFLTLILMSILTGKQDIFDNCVQTGYGYKNFTGLDYLSIKLYMSVSITCSS